MATITAQPRGRKPNSVDYDLPAARRYLRRLARAMIEAAFSPDPRAVALGIELVRYQGKVDR